MFQGQEKLKVVGRVNKKWQELTDSVLYCIAKDIMPIHTVEKEEFKALLKQLELKQLELKYEMLHQKYFSKTALPALYAKTQEVVNKGLEEVKEKGYFAAITDVWSSTTSKAYISYIVHIIN